MPLRGSPENPLSAYISQKRINACMLWRRRKKSLRINNRHLRPLPAQRRCKRKKKYAHISSRVGIANQSPRKNLNIYFASPDSLCQGNGGERVSVCLVIEGGASTV